MNKTIKLLFLYMSFYGATSCASKKPMVSEETKSPIIQETKITIENKPIFQPSINIDFPEPNVNYTFFEINQYLTLAEELKDQLEEKEKKADFGISSISEKEKNKLKEIWLF